MKEVKAPQMNQENFVGENFLHQKMRQVQLAAKQHQLIRSFSELVMTYEDIVGEHDHFLAQQKKNRKIKEMSKNQPTKTDAN